MTANVTYLIILIIVLGFVLLWLIFGRKKSSGKPKSSLYTQALDHIIHRDYESAIKELKAIIKKDTNHIDAYIKLGNLLRETGQIKAAVKVHQGLLYRQDIDKTQKLEIMRNLVDDYIELDEKGIALSVALNVLDVDKRNMWALEKIWHLYRDLKKWAKASEFMEKILRYQKKSNSRILAIYKVQEGLEKYEAGNFHDARLIFRRAMKIDPGCEAPYFYMAESYVKDRRELDAVEWWVKFAEAAPEKAWLVFNPLQKVLFNIGNFGKIEDFYLNILKNRQNDVRTITALANYYERKGDLQKASNLVEDLIENNPNSTIAKIAYCKLLVFVKCEKEVGDGRNYSINQFDSVDHVRCSNCGHQVQDILWICPMCGAEDSFLNQL
ncbi:MAG: hypothetical protein J7L86_01700 [Candidatus Marinimicrobia bacterium]|nr:hypothetical protein [Candidatus Neomarinimicrobiota bacterium]